MLSMTQFAGDLRRSSFTSFGFSLAFSFSLAAFGAAGIRRGGGGWLGPSLTSPSADRGRGTVSAVAARPSVGGSALYIIVGTIYSRALLSTRWCVTARLIIKLKLIE